MYTTEDNTIFIGLEYYLGSTITSGLISAKLKALECNNHAWQVVISSLRLLETGRHLAMKFRLGFPYFN